MNNKCMTLGELDIFRRLDAFRTLKKAYRGHQILHLVVDSSAWNNRFRTETVEIPMSQTLDKIFDTPVFSKTHESFMKTLLYNLYVPDKDNTYYWEGQAGGIEGLNQDTWVVVYIAQVKTALAPFPYKYHISCKGDDIRISFAIPDGVILETPMLVITNQIIDSIQRVLSKFGHKINIQESYGLSVYYAFSKYSSVDRVEMPQTFRKIQKVHGANNALIPTLEEYIASTFSNAHTACKQIRA
jgi:Paramyxovirus RNA dependent RNA polymerase.